VSNFKDVRSYLLALVLNKLIILGLSLNKLADWLRAGARTRARQASHPSNLD